VPRYPAASAQRCKHGSHWQIANEKEFDKLMELPDLEELVFYGNPLMKAMVDKEGELAWPMFVASKLPNLRKLDGISMVEWNQKMNAGNSSQLKEVFDKMDTDKSGSLDQKELGEALKDDEIRTYLQITQAQVDNAFKKMDEMGTGEVKWDEFEKYFQV